MKSYRRSHLALPLAAAGVLLCAVHPSTAQVTEMLHETQDGTRDNYTGVIGNEFKIGSSNVVVSHLGIYDNNGDGLAQAHIAGIFNATGSAVLGQVAFSADSSAYFTNGVRWMPLDPPLLLQANTAYVLGADVFNASGDPWKDSFSPTNWNVWFVGTNAAATRRTRYSSGGTAWPAFPSGAFGSDSTYGNVSLAYIEIDKARAGVASTNLAVSAGQALNFVGFASGAPGIAYQWYKEPGTALTGKTTASFTIASAAVSDSGTYYLTATNGLGGSKSANVTVTVTALPAGVQVGPTNLTVLANFTAAFSAVVTGSPPISVQWLRNGTPVTGATSTSYSFTASLTNNGDQYSIFASNNISGTPYTATSASATLTVIPNLSQAPQILHGAPPTTLTTNSFVGSVGGSFITGNQETLVTHLGYLATKYTDATHADLSDDHAITIYNANYTTNVSVVVTAGTGLPVINGYIWAALNPPVKLAPNTTYILGADTSANDPWGSTYSVPDWSSYYTDPSQANSFAARYNNTGLAPYYGGYNGQMYSAPNMAVLPVGSPSAWVSPTVVTQYAGLSVTLTGLVNGEPPVTAQWFKAPGTLLAGETNLILTLTSPVETDSGDYYLMASNSLGTAQSGNATVTIIPDVGPGIVEDVQSQTVLVYTTVKFSVTADGTPPLSYQWSFNGNPISGATNSVLTLYNASSSTVGDYRVAITNPYGSTNSSIATLDVTAPPWGTYASSVMEPDLLAYYRFSDVLTGVATNMGSLGFAYNGLYEGFYAATDGPLNMSHFGADNMAVLLDGSTSDVKIPALNVRVTNATIAAWVYSGGGQDNDDAIYFHRGGSVFGLSVFPDTNSLKYTWAGTMYNFQTGLVLPTNEWALVAMSVTPSNGTVYLRDGTGLKSATNVTAHVPMTFDSASYVGWDTAGGLTGRYWTGGIDELMIFDRALSAVEINALYLGVPGSAVLKITRSGANVVLSWPGGTLQEADDPAGPWTSLPSATSPYQVSSGGPMKYYRVQLQP